MALGRGPARLRAWARPAVAVVALLALGVALAQPIWVAHLDAPQYPKGLVVRVHGDRIEGDIREVNGLNHYIGMRTIDPAAIPEMRLWPLAPVFAGIFAVIALFRRGWPSVLARIGLWAVPLTVLGDIQRWLMVYGRDLDREAALRLKPFVPLVVGPTSVWNFKIWALPGPALLILLGVALAVTIAARGPAPPATPRAHRGPGFAAIGTSVLILALGLGSAGCGPPRPADSHAIHAPPPDSALDRSPAADRVTAPASPASFDLRAAIASAPGGAVLRVPAGTYRGPLAIERPLTLVADGPVVLDGSGAGTVLAVRAPSVTVRGFVIRGSGGQIEDGAGIAVLADDARIESNSLDHMYTGIAVRGARDVRLVDNHVTGAGPARAGTGNEELHDETTSARGDGLSLWNVSGALVRGNRVTGMRDGIYLSYADDVLLDSNRIAGSRYAVHSMFGRSLTVFGNEIEGNAAGLVLMNTTSVEVARNLLIGQRSAATGYGILLKDVMGARLVENVAIRNSVGLRVDGVDRLIAAAEVIRNEFAYNGVGIQLLPSAKLVFTRNAFVDNGVQVDLPASVSARANEWSKSGLGNYWSGSLALDADGDGVAEAPHREGTAAARLLREAPELLLFRGSLATAVVARAERWWNLAQAATVIDPIPLARPLSPAPAPRAAEGGPGWLAFGSALLSLPAAALVASRRQRIR